MPRRHVDAHLITAAIFHQHFNFHETAAAGAALVELRIIAAAGGGFVGINFFIQCGDLRAAHGFVAEAPYRELAVEHTGGDAVRQAELAFQPRYRARVDQHVHATGRHAANHLVHAGCIKLEFVA